MKTLKLVLAVACAGAMLTGCSASFHARDADSYRKVTREVLETRNADIKSCYDAELAKDASVTGKVVVKFTVEKESGKITNAKIDADESNGPPSLGECVLKAIDGLKVEPPDQRTGKATFRWEFSPKAAS